MQTSSPFTAPISMSRKASAMRLAFANSIASFGRINPVIAVFGKTSSRTEMLSVRTALLSSTMMMLGVSLLSETALTKTATSVSRHSAILTIIVVSGSLVPFSHLAMVGFVTNSRRASISCESPASILFCLIIFENELCIFIPLNAV